MFVQLYNTLQQNIKSSIFIDYMLLLLLLPFLYAIVEVFYRKKIGAKKGKKIYFFTHSQFVLLIYVGVQLFVVSPKELPFVFGMAIVAEILYIPLFALLKKIKPRKKRKEVVKTKEIEIQAETVQQEKKIEKRELPMDDAVCMQKDIHITHIYKTLESLRRQKLTAGDRLECKKIEEILKLYQMKERLTAVETSLLNDILASLLKMMAKYTV